MNLKYRTGTLLGLNSREIWEHKRLNILRKITITLARYFNKQPVIKIFRTQKNNLNYCWDLSLKLFITFGNM